MHPNEGLGLFGWLCLGLVLAAAAVAFTFGFASLFYFAILLVPVVFVALLMLCGGKVEGEA